MAYHRFVFQRRTEQLLDMAAAKHFGLVRHVVGRADPARALRGHILKGLEMACVAQVVGGDHFADLFGFVGRCIGAHAARHTVQGVHCVLQGLGGVLLQKPHCHQPVGRFRGQGLLLVLRDGPPCLGSDRNGCNGRKQQQGHAGAQKCLDREILQGHCTRPSFQDCSNCS